MLCYEDSVHPLTDFYSFAILLNTGYLHPIQAFKNPTNEMNLEKNKQTKKQNRKTITAHVHVESEPLTCRSQADIASYYMVTSQKDWER